MGYGIGTNHVDVTVSVNQPLHDFALEVGSVVARLLAAGCRQFKVDVHDRGAVVTGNQAVQPLDLGPEAWNRKTCEVLHG